MIRDGRYKLYFAGFNYALEMKTRTWTIQQRIQYIKSRPLFNLLGKREEVIQQLIDNPVFLQQTLEESLFSVFRFIGYKIPKNV